MKARRYYILLILALGAGGLFAQNLESLSTSKAFAFSGSLYVSGDSYASFGSDPLRRSPYSYSITGAPVVSIYGIKLPFSFAFSDQQFSYSQPFNIYGLSPNYKWATLHLGYRSLNFSSFTLAGKQFFGAGIELTPGKFRFLGLYGSLRDLYAQKDTLTFGSQILDTYDRKIHGFKIGYGQRSKIELSYIKVKDRENSSMIQEADNIYLFPEDNFVLGLNTDIQFHPKLFFYLESAASLHTSNLTTDITIEDEKLERIANRVSDIIEINATTRWGFAGKTGLKLSLGNYGLGVNYLRVDPYYKSLGLYYTNTDYEIYSANMYLGLFQSTLRLSLTGGYQQNNLSKSKEQTDLRKIGSINVSYFTPAGLGLIVNYSNYQTDQSAGYIRIEDSLKLALVNELAMISTNYAWQNDRLSQNLSLNVSYQKFLDINEFRTEKWVDDHNYLGSLDYSLSVTPKKLTLNAGVNYYYLISGPDKSTQYGISAGVGKPFLKNKLNTRFSCSWNKNYYQSYSDGYSAYARLRTSWQFSKNQELALYMYWLVRTGNHFRNMNELRSSVHYSLSF